MIYIDGIPYLVPVRSLKRKADFLDKTANRTEDGVLHRELIGVYFNYQLQFGNTTNTAEYRRLWNKLTEPDEFHAVGVPSVDGLYTFTAYFSNVGDEMLREYNELNFFKNLTVNFTAREPARK